MATYNEIYPLIGVMVKFVIRVVLRGEYRNEIWRKGSYRRRYA